MLIDLQRAMLAACYGDPSGYAATLPHLSPTGIAADKALYIHTATVTAALTGVLAEAYPSVLALLGEEAFADAARLHLRGHPPEQAVLSAYGAGFGQNLSDPLPLLALLDWAAHQAYFAADARPLTAEGLNSLPPDAVAGLCLRPVPSASLLTGPLDGLTAWQTGRPDIVAVPPPLPLTDHQAAALIWRGPDLLVAATRLPPDAGAFIAALGTGADLLTAAGHLSDGNTLPPILALMLSHGLIAATEDELPSC